jgi:hypothetical protein
MPTVADAPSRVQVCYSFTAGALIREDGRTRPATLDDIQRQAGATLFEEAMCRPGEWIDVPEPEQSIEESGRRMNHNLIQAARAVTASMNLVLDAMGLPPLPEPLMPGDPVRIKPHVMSYGYKTGTYCHTQKDGRIVVQFIRTKIGPFGGPVVDTWMHPEGKYRVDFDPMDVEEIPPHPVEQLPAPRPITIKVDRPDPAAWPKPAA